VSTVVSGVYGPGVSTEGTIVAGIGSDDGTATTSLAGDGGRAGALLAPLTSDPVSAAVAGLGLGDTNSATTKNTGARTSATPYGAAFVALLVRQ
jgi:hypothetical protein